MGMLGGSAIQVPSTSLPRTKSGSGMNGVRARRGAVVARAAVMEDDKDPEFNLSKAVVLGSAAFGAYLDPNRKKGVERYLTDGCGLRFFDSDFVREGYEGVLELSAISVTNAAREDWRSKSDVYLRVTLDDAFAETSVKKNKENPKWDEPLYLWVVKGKGVGDVTVAAFDSDVSERGVQVSADDPIGSVTLPLGDLGDASKTFDMKLQGKDADDGELHITASYLPFGGAAGDQFLKDVDDSTATEMAAGAPAAARALQESLSEPGTPEAPDLVKAWDELCNVYSNNVFEDKRTVAFLEHQGTGTQVWISRDIPQKKVLVAFRGTEPTHPADIFTDVDLRQTPIEVCLKRNRNWIQKILDFPRFSTFKRSAPAVHSGFHRSYTAVQEELMDIIDACTGGDKNWRVYCTGHSLGGGLAVLLAFELSQRATPDPRYHISMYNYGGPRVGNIPFVDLYKVADSWRVHNENDLVAQIPIAGLMGYRHVDAGVRILDNGEGFKFTDANNDDVEVPAGARWTPRNIVRRIEDKLEDYGELMAKNREFLRTISKGTGSVAEHLEDQYVEGLVHCIEDADGAAEAKAASEKALVFVEKSRNKDEVQSAPAQV